MHIAWRTSDDEDQLDWKNYIKDNGYVTTPVKDRNYFHSIYFKEHGEILFEIATDSPGFTIDEPRETLGEKLMLPKQFDPKREQIEQVLIPIIVRKLD
ncbi:glyoxalase family protein [Neobacillus massiliamazoniensis]|uniref:Glyoxalase family protein n=1 Tax=Neobacillus massiliamazoniensis TaxID=1499688 RepID=A0A0U1P4I3_9BACI|nr:glyoxalase family protein [Neobacillus massiliamazoniensis]